LKQGSNKVGSAASEARLKEGRNKAETTSPVVRILAFRSGHTAKLFWTIARLQKARFLQMSGLLSNRPRGRGSKPD
jgi:hypothetical protein